MIEALKLSKDAKRFYESLSVGEQNEIAALLVNLMPPGAYNKISTPFGSGKFRESRTQNFLILHYVDANVLNVTLLRPGYLF